MQQLNAIWTMINSFVTQSGSALLAIGFCGLTLLVISITVYFSTRLRVLSTRQRRLAQAMESHAAVLEKMQSFIENKMNVLSAPQEQFAASKANLDLQVALMREELSSLHQELLSEIASQPSVGEPAVL